MARTGFSLLLHFHLSYSLLDSPLALALPESAIKALVRSGNYGVTMFFVISGSCRQVWRGC
jgi:hypothetical protein